jgi:uncharacterized protein (DUF433 family)
MFSEDVDKAACTFLEGVRRPWFPTFSGGALKWVMPLSERIIVDSQVLAGKPVIRGTRLAVEFILELLAAGQSESEILTSYPGLSRDDILACLSYASYLAHEFRAYPIPA